MPPTDLVQPSSIGTAVYHSDTSLAPIPTAGPTTVIITSTRPGTTVINTRSSISAPISSPSALPLTTFFTPPSDCRAVSAYWQPGNATGIDSTATCYPQSWESYQKTANGFYSPGVCPLSYEWPTVSIVAAANGEGAPVTQALCCPNGLSRLGYYQYTPYCYNGPTLGAGTSGRFALPVSVAWRESDLTSFTPASAPVLALRRNGWDAAGADTNPSGDLSTGTAAGIGVSVGVLVLAAFVGLLWCFRRRRRSRKRAAPTGDVAAEVDSGFSYSRAEKDGRERFELSSSGKPVEAEDKGLAELDSGWQAAEVEGSGPHDRGSIVQ